MRHWRPLRRCAVLVVVLAAACKGPSESVADQEDGTTPPPSPTSPSISVTDEPAGANCPAGGKRITVQSGASAPAVSYVCNGQPGQPGSSGGSAAAWDTTAAASTVAAPNRGYFAAGAARVTLRLPASDLLSPGDVFDVLGVGTGGFAVVPGAGQQLLFGDGVTAFPGDVWTPRDESRSWGPVAASADGSHLVSPAFMGSIYTSGDFGLSWTPGGPAGSNGSWVAVASSADGTRLFAATSTQGARGQIYLSTDSGAHWVLCGPDLDWSALAPSADGNKLLAATKGGNLWTFTDVVPTGTGAPCATRWAREGARAWSAVASSADGTKLVAAVKGGQLYTSVNSGLDWTVRESSRGWEAVASSASGARLVAAANAAPGNGQLYFSEDSGQTWVPRGDASRSWPAIASSADGTRLVGIGCTGVGSCALYTSADSGATWSARGGAVKDWVGVASSANGARVAASARYDRLHTSSAPSGSSALLEGAFGARLQLRYTGSDSWIVSDVLGAIAAY